MSNSLRQPFQIALGASIPLSIATVARSQSSEDEEETKQIHRQTESAKNQIEKAKSQIGQSITPSAGTTTVVSGQVSYALPTPLTIAVALAICGLTIFPVVHLLWNAKKAAVAGGKNSLWSKLTGKFQKAHILESDAFLHQRHLEKLTQIVDKAENIDAQRFDNAEFKTFFTIKSYIARSIGEYANLDEIVELLKAAIDAQESFTKIDNIESRNCSRVQQEVYQLTTALLFEGVEGGELIAQVHAKIEEVIPRLQTDEGREAIASYSQALTQISRHPLALKLLTLFKQEQLADYSVLRTISLTVSSLEKQNLLDVDALMVMVMSQYSTYEKLGPLLGIAADYHRPETYSKLLQYIGLKSRHEASYQKFKEFLTVLQPWETYYQQIVSIRKKYSAKEYQLPKDFSVELAGVTLYQKYKDSFHLLDTPAQPAQPQVEMVAAAKTGQEQASASLTLTGIR